MVIRMQLTSIEIALRVNGQEHRVKTNPRRSLLSVLREDLGLIGAKYGCGEGQCGACTVLIDGDAVRSCIRRVEDLKGRDIVTIEGLEKDGQLHPLQQSFLDHDALQCGYCTPGMIMSALALLNKNPRPESDEIIEFMEGNICRCCAYPSILKAILQVADSDFHRTES